VGDLIRRGTDPAAIRHQLLSAQYRRELNFTMSGLEASAKAVQRLLDFQTRLVEAPVQPGSPSTGISKLAEEALQRFREGMDDDLNSAEGLAALFIFLNEVNAELDRVGSDLSPEDRDAGLEALSSMDQVLGLLELANDAREVDDATEDWIQEQIRLRKKAREDRDFAAADGIRDALAAKGIVLEDSPEGTRWKVVK
jgi:cysteinyl-tRNA synthetase